jgi:hypothetical protein
MDNDLFSLYGTPHSRFEHPFGGAYHTLSSNPWASIIDVPRGKEHVYNQMPAMGGYTATAPATVMDSTGSHEVEIYFKAGKKRLRKVPKPKDEKKRVTRDEAMESPDKMFLYLKQFNKKEDQKWEEAELKAYDDGDDGMNGGAGAQ